MSKILKVSQGDYRIQVPTGNSITLDTGTTGSVIITGDLDIKGQTTTIESVNATVSDNILVLNKGEPHTNGTGITLGSSGIQIDRGRDGNVILSTRIVYDESVNHYNPISTNTEAGTYVLSSFRDSSATLASLQVSSIELSAISSNGTNTNGIAFNLRGSDTTLTVVNSTHNEVPYENRLIDSSLTTKLYVKTYVVSGNLKPATTFTPFLGSMADVDTIYKKTADVPGVPGSIKALVETTTNSEIIFKIDQTQRAVITTAGLSVDTINLFGNLIKNVGSGSPLVQLPLVLTSDANLVEVNAVLTLDDQSSSEQLTVATTAIANKTKIYSKDIEGPGRTGIYFTNNNTYGANAYNNDELVSRNRAVLLSMLF
jgi:hypothetical protein